MKAYDKIFVEAPSKKETDYYMDNMGDLFPLKELPAGFVLTEEELWEMWCACAQSQVDHETMKVNEENFKNYIKSKQLTNAEIR